MIHFKLASIAGVKFDEDVYEVLVPTQAGTIAVYQDHMPLISAGAPGVISIRKNQRDRDEALEHFAVSGGVVQVDGKNINFLSDDVTTSSEVSESEAEAAVNRAQEMMAGAQTQQAMHEAKRMLARSSAQLHIARLKKRHHS
jgi:F-type H+-transporting ATPase subunit epsilon